MGRRLKASERRATILAVAKLLFADKGYHGVSVDEIARRLGVSPAILYRHFPSKEALYEAVLNDIACRRESYVEAVVDSEGGFEDVLRRITRLFMRRVAADPDYLRMEMHAALEDGAAARRFFEQRWRPFTALIEDHLADRPGLARHASLMFQGLVREALYQKCILHTETYQDITVEELGQRLIDLFLAALGEAPVTASRSQMR